MPDGWGWTSIPVCGVCGRDMGGTEIDHTTCFERARRSGVTLIASPAPNMDFRVRRVVLIDHAQEPARRVDDTGTWDVSVQDDGHTLKLFKLPAQQTSPEETVT